MPILNYTSGVDADKTALEISRCLSSHGAQGVLTEYNKELKTIEAISFRIPFGPRMIDFKLPCDWHPVYEILKKDSSLSSDRYMNDDRRAMMESKIQEQAVRTAWRIVKDWVEAQMALVEVKMARTEEIFLPYAVMPNGKTLAQNIVTDPGLLLGNKN